MKQKISICNSDIDKKICVIGLGYIGLPTGAVLAKSGYQVHGVDINLDTVAAVQNGQATIEEPGLPELLKAVVGQGLLTASNKVEASDIYIICVPTPFTSTKEPDLSFVQSAARQIKDFIKPGDMIILESTSPPRTTEKIVQKETLGSKFKVGVDVFVAHCPERVIPGRILDEVINNDRIVGGVTTTCSEKVAEFYESFVKGKVLITTAINAELTKLIENSYRDVNIAFANELSLIADKFNTSPFEIIDLANHHPRVNILKPGPGVGGHCISVDPWFLVSEAPNQTQLIKTARIVNDSKPEFVIRQANKLVQDISNPKICCLGLTYKADVDDFRESPSLEIARKLTSEYGESVLCCEPYATVDQFADLFFAGMEDAVNQADLIVLLTDHTCFKNILPDDLVNKRVLDTRGFWLRSENSCSIEGTHSNVESNSQIESFYVTRAA